MIFFLFSNFHLKRDIVLINLTLPTLITFEEEAELLLEIPPSRRFMRYYTRTRMCRLEREGRKEG